MSNIWLFIYSYCTLFNCKEYKTVMYKNKFKTIMIRSNTTICCVFLETFLKHYYYRIFSFTILRLMIFLRASHYNHTMLSKPPYVNYAVIVYGRILMSLESAFVSDRNFILKKWKINTIGVLINYSANLFYETLICLISYFNSYQ